MSSIVVIIDYWYHHKLVYLSLFIVMTSSMGRNTRDTAKFVNQFTAYYISIIITITIITIISMFITHYSFVVLFDSIISIITRYCYLYCYHYVFIFIIAYGLALPRLSLAYSRSPLDDSRLFGPSPWKILATTYEQKGLLSNPAPGENIPSGNLVMETGCTQSNSHTATSTNILYTDMLS